MPGLTMFLLLAGVLASALLAFTAFSGPSAGKQLTRRLEELRERHSRSTDIAAQAQLKRIFAQRQNRGDSVAKRFIPKPALLQLRLSQTGFTEVSRKDFEHSIERKVDIVLPFDPKTAAQAAKLGQPLAKVTKSAKLSQPLNQLLALTVEQAAEGADEVRPASGGSLLGKLGNFKALVAKKPKEASAAA